MTWFADNARTIGRTPLVRLNRYLSSPLFEGVFDAQGFSV
jgi:hypothetical protein